MPPDHTATGQDSERASSPANTYWRNAPAIRLPDHEPVTFFAAIGQCPTTWKRCGGDGNWRDCQPPRAYMDPPAAPPPPTRDAHGVVPPGFPVEHGKPVEFFARYPAGPGGGWYYVNHARTWQTCPPPMTEGQAMSRNNPNAPVPAAPVLGVRAGPAGGIPGGKLKVIVGGQEIEPRMVVLKHLSVSVKTCREILADIDGADAAMGVIRVMAPDWTAKQNEIDRLRRALGSLAGHLDITNAGGIALALRYADGGEHSLRHLTEAVGIIESANGGKS